VWQADAVEGRYEHPRVPASVPRDPGFSYLGRTISDEGGYYRFRSIIPPPYPAGPEWHRSRHIHVAVLRPGRETFFTELHFAGDGWIAQDRFLNRAVPDLAPLLVDFHKTLYKWEVSSEPSEVLVGRFDIVL
jgi:protocatechuate 3,4-dioxygenase beta subunit